MSSHSSSPPEDDKSPIGVTDATSSLPNIAPLLCSVPDHDKFKFWKHMGILSILPVVQICSKPRNYQLLTRTQSPIVLNIERCTITDFSTTRDRGCRVLDLLPLDCWLNAVERQYFFRKMKLLKPGWVAQVGLPFYLCH